MIEDNRLLQTVCFLLDMDGTIYLGNRLIGRSDYFLNIIPTLGKEFLLLTNNSSQHRQLYAEKIARMGLRIPPEKILTSGEATALFLSEKMPAARIYLAGTPALEEEFISHGFVLVQERPDAVVLGFDTTLTYEKLWKLCDFARAGYPYFATHGDFNCPIENGYKPDIGAMIAFIKASTGREPDQVIGKPNREILKMASRKTNVPVESFAMVGDRLYTDIAFGQTVGIPTVLVLSGETSRDDIPLSPYQPDFIFPDLGSLADYLVMNSK